MRKAEKSGLDSEDGGIELLDAFYAVFSHNMRDLGTPVYGVRFLQGGAVHLSRGHACIHRAPCGASRRGVYRALARAPRSRCPGPRRFESSTRCAPTCCCTGACCSLRRIEASARSTSAAPRPNEGTFHFKQQWGAAVARARLGILDGRRQAASQPEPLELEVWSCDQGLAAPAALGGDDAGTCDRSQHSLKVMLPLLVGSLAALIYVYVGYPLLLRALVWARGARPVRRKDIVPSLSLVISAYNEAAVIRKKIENALGLDYPAEARQIVVVSDASSDGTDEIVSAYAGRNVVLMRQDERRGKTEGLNRTVPLLTGDVVVFSDANAMYESDALRKLVRNFGDPIGRMCHRRGTVPAGGTRDRGHRRARVLGLRDPVKRLETALGSMVGGDGAIYAIRRSLWQTLPENAINDFLNPLQIVAKGWRSVYEPEAICYEESAGKVRSEYRRRVRIVSRSWRAVFQAPGVLNPVRGGIVQLVLGVSQDAPLGVGHRGDRCVRCVRQSVCRGTREVAGFGACSDPGVGRGGCGHIGRPAPRGNGRLLRGYQYGVARGPGEGQLRTCLRDVVNASRADGCCGRTSRGRSESGPSFSSRLALGCVAVLVSVPLQGAPIRVLAFWFSAATLVYVYLAYPLALVALRLVAPRTVLAQPIEPSVCLLIAANDEATVIEAKLQNALGLDYPTDKLAVLVASDGSIDGTNAIVRRFAPRVRLLELFPRRGKIAAINAGMQAVTSEIVIFSDANTFLEPDAVRRLVRNFADPRVGAVSGDVALVGERAALARSEDLYYQYERFVQKAESDIGSMIGADGALYAVRRSLFVPPADDTILDDMAIPMSIVRSGHRVVYEPGARAHEHGSETAIEEFARKSRVIAGAVQFMSRRDSSVPLARPQVLLSLVSHKALRWLSPAFATCALVTSAALMNVSSIYMAAAVLQGSLVVLGLIGCVPLLRRNPVISFAHYFCLVQAAAAVGFVRGLSGQQSVLWRRFVRGPVA